VSTYHHKARSLYTHTPTVVVTPIHLLHIHVAPRGALYLQHLITQAILLTLELDGIDSALLDEAHRRLDGLLRRSLVRAEGQVPHDEGPLGSPGHGSAVGEHLGDGHRQRGVVAVHHHGHRVAHQQQVYASQVDLRASVVCEHLGKVMGRSGSKRCTEHTTSMATEPPSSEFRPSKSTCRLCYESTDLPMNDARTARKTA